MLIRLLLAVMLCSVCSYSAAQDIVYRGEWKTRNRKLDGQMTCVVTPKAKEQWKGRFYGVWQGVDFDYTVDFAGPPNDLRGTATIDGAAYTWRARMDKDRFRANFGGDRYSGSFDLKKSTATDTSKVAQGRSDKPSKSSK